MRRSAGSETHEKGLDPKIVLQAKYGRLEAQSGVQLADRGRRKLRRHNVQWRGQPDDVHLHVETRLSLLRNLLDAFRSQALRCAAVRWRAAGHVCRRAMHRGNHGGAGSGAGDHPHRNEDQRHEAEDAAMSREPHIPTLYSGRPERSDAGHG